MIMTNAKCKTVQRAPPFLADFDVSPPFPSQVDLHFSLNAILAENLYLSLPVAQDDGSISQRRDFRIRLSVRLRSDFEG